MTQAARRDRNRVDTDQSIRTVARTLLVSRGRQGVTLRAIAREMGITAPALYRYYDSFEDLIRHVCTDICADLTAEFGEGAIVGRVVTEQVAHCPHPGVGRRGELDGLLRGGAQLVEQDRT